MKKQNEVYTLSTVIGVTGQSVISFFQFLQASVFKSHRSVRMEVSRGLVATGTR